MQVRTPGTAGRRRRSGSSRAHDLTSCGSPAGGGSAPVTAATAHAAVLAGRANDTANAEAQAFSLPVPDAQLLATIEAACASIPGATETAEDRGKGQETSAEAGQSVPRSEGSVGTPTRVVRRDGHLAKRAAKPSKQAARSRSKKPKVCWVWVIWTVVTLSPGADDALKIVQAVVGSMHYVVLLHCRLHDLRAVCLAHPGV